MMNPILAIDFGRVRIGVAISDELQLLAHPLETIPASERAAARVAEIVRERKVDHVVVGIPRQMKGGIGAAATETRQCAGPARSIRYCRPPYGCSDAVMCRSISMHVFPPKEKCIAIESGSLRYCRPLNSGAPGM